MTILDQTLDLVARCEGGFVDNPHDTGGATNRGITLRELRVVVAGATVEQLKALDAASARLIIKTLYFDQPGISALPDKLIPQVGGFAVNGGPAAAIRLLQRAMDLDEVGKIGPLTRLGAGNCDIARLDRVIVAHYEWIVKANASQNVFLKGWLNREAALYALAKTVRS